MTWLQGFDTLIVQKSSSSMELETKNRKWHIFADLTNYRTFKQIGDNFFPNLRVLQSFDLRRRWLSTCLSVENTEFYSHGFLTKIPWSHAFIAKLHSSESCFHETLFWEEWIFLFSTLCMPITQEDLQKCCRRCQQ